MTSTPASEVRFDTHCHLFEFGYHARRQHEELHTYEQFRHRYNIQRSIVVGYERELEHHGNNRYIAELASRHDWLLPFAYISADAGVANPPRAIATYAFGQAQGQGVAELLADIRRKGRPVAAVSLNADPPALESLKETIAGSSDTWFLISHLGLPGPIRQDDDLRDRLAVVLELGKFSNTTIKISGQYAASAAPKSWPHSDVQVVVDTLANDVGVASLVWGSDFSPVLDAVSFDAAVHCLFPTGATAEETHAILFENASRMQHEYLGC